LTEVCMLFSSDTYNVLTSAAIGSCYFTLGLYIRNRVSLPLTEARATLL
jgi:hypothetical protein